MSQLSNPYQKQPPALVTTDDDDNISMQDNSPSSKNSGSKGLKQKKEGNDKDDQLHSPKQGNEEEAINFDEHPFQIPFHLVNPSLRKPCTTMTGPKFSGHPCSSQFPRTLAIRWQ